MYTINLANHEWQKTCALRSEHGFMVKAVQCANYFTMESSFNQFEKGNAPVHHVKGFWKIYHAANI